MLKWSAQQGSALIVAQCSGSLGCMARYAGNFATGQKMVLFPTFDAKISSFSKTGSGQTQRKLKTRTVFSTEIYNVSAVHLVDDWVFIEPANGLQAYGLQRSVIPTHTVQFSDHVSLVCLGIMIRVLEE